MKIIAFSGGLGNQIFEYANYCRLKVKYPSENFYSFFPKRALAIHNGLEIEKRFKINLPNTSKFSDVIGILFFYIYKLCWRLHIHLGFMSDRFHPNDEAIYFSGWYGDRKFIPDGFMLDFNVQNISEKNKHLVEFILANNTVSIHVRRGDFMNEKNIANYGSICTESYYKKAIEKIKTITPDIHFLFFSDDTEYVRQHFNIANMTIVDWNKGEDSFMDMYLMSICDYMILANSTFSYWAARFNKRVKCVFCPTRWMNDRQVDLTPENWIQIES